MAVRMASQSLRLAVGSQVELNKSRRADVQEALQDRNILPSKTLPDMKATLAAVIAREKGPRPILIPKTLKVTAGRWVAEHLPDCNAETLL
jgi:hypothetical protein